MVDLRGRDFLKLLDFTPKEIEHLLKTAVKFKKMKHEGTPHNYLKGKQIAIIFEKDSNKTTFGGVLTIIYLIALLIIATN